MIKTFLDGVQLPVNPFDDITLTTQGNNKQVEIIAIGDVTQIGTRKLAAISIKSIFTDNIYPWSAISNPKPPKYYVTLIEKAMKRQRSVRLLIVGDGVDINLRCSIENFKTTQAAGETNEYYYTLSLKEYRTPCLKYVDIIPSELSKPKAQVLSARVENPPKARTHTAKSGDTLWAMAKTYYGNGAEYMKIYNANKNLNPSPNDIYVGQVFVIP
ncbi:MAG: LysM peptidoglycan-binding domain-containing protein [Hydrogenoanaerobacterium sp.]